MTVPGLTSPMIILSPFFLSDYSIQSPCLFDPPPIAPPHPTPNASKSLQLPQQLWMDEWFQEHSQRKRKYFKAHRPLLAPRLLPEIFCVSLSHGIWVPGDRGGYYAMFTHGTRYTLVVCIYYLGVYSPGSWAGDECNLSPRGNTGNMQRVLTHELVQA